MSRLSFSVDEGHPLDRTGRPENRGHGEEPDEGDAAGDQPPLATDGAVVLRQGAQQVGVGQRHGDRLAATAEHEPHHQGDHDGHTQGRQDEPRLAQRAAQERGQGRLQPGQVHSATT